MNIEDLTIGEAKKLAGLLACGTPQQPEQMPYKVGQPYLIRTVTNYYTGRLTWVGSKELILADAAWIADTGRYHMALETGELSEVEPIKGPCIIGRGSIIDAVEWPNNIALPRTVK